MITKKPAACFKRDISDNIWIRKPNNGSQWHFNLRLLFNRSFRSLHVALIASTGSTFSRPFSRNWVVTQKCASPDNPYSRQNRDSIIVVLITLVTNALRLHRGKIFSQLYNPLESTHTSWPRGNSLYWSCQNASRSIVKAKSHYSTAQLPSGNRDKTAV